MSRTLLTRIAFVLTLTLVLSGSADAQRGRLPPSGQGSSEAAPKWWGSLWGGYEWSDPVDDGRSAATWEFDSGWVLRGTIERSLGRNTAIGLAFNYVRMPLIFFPFDATSCTTCGATATMATYGLLLRGGGSTRLHLVYEGFAGAMQFGNFEFDTPPTQPTVKIKNTDFAFAFGTGFGYSLSQDFQLLAMYEVANNVHERAPDFGGRRLSRHYTTRLGLRIGF